MPYRPIGLVADWWTYPRCFLSASTELSQSLVQENFELIDRTALDQHVPVRARRFDLFGLERGGKPLGLLAVLTAVPGRR